MDLYQSRLKILRKYYKEIGTIVGFDIKGEIPIKKMDVAIKSFAKGIEKRNIIGLYDTTINQSGKIGYLFTDTEIRYLVNIGDSRSLKYDDISGIEVFDVKKKDDRMGIRFFLKDDSVVEWTDQYLNNVSLMKFLSEICYQSPPKNKNKLKEEKEHKNYKDNASDEEEIQITSEKKQSDVVTKHSKKKNTSPTVKKEHLQLRQYLNIHPMLDKEEKTRSAYVDLLSYFVGITGRGNLWSNQLLRLYADRLVNKEKKLLKADSKGLRKIKKEKLFKYRFYLLTDCLFIRCFDNKRQGKQVLDDIIGFYGERYRTSFEFIYNAFYTTGGAELFETYPDMKEMYSVIWSNRSFRDKPLKNIMITANMSAGKSTLLNALTGKKVTKTQNDTCTAKIHYLLNKAGEDGLSYELDHDLELDATMDILMTDNEKNDSLDIIVGTRFRSLTDVDLPVCFIDTPGVNSSMNKEHRCITNEAIETIDYDVLLYLFNGENIGSDDDKAHLKYVKDHHKGKIIFLVNRLDRYKSNVDSVSQTIDSVYKDLIEIGFDNPIVYPLSAYAGYLGKMILYGEELTEDEIDDMQFALRKLRKDDFSYEKYYPFSIDITCHNKEVQELLIHSGILSLEKILYQ